MGKTDTAMYSFLSDRARFADLFNGILFKGKQIIQEKDLSAASERYASTKEAKPHPPQNSSLSPQATDRFRDIKMYLNTGETLRLLALENQSLVDYTLPYRLMDYDCLEYGKQLKELKYHNRIHKNLHTPEELLCGITQKDKFTPVYTICLYHGEEAWNGPTDLRGMMDFGEDSDKMSDFFINYPMHLYCINEQTDFNVFHTELREVFTAMSCRKNKARLRAFVSKETYFKQLSEDAVNVLSATLNIPNLWTQRKKYIIHCNETGNEKEAYDMCQAMQELLEDIRNEGKLEGKEEGSRSIITLMQKLLADNRLDELKEALETPSLLQQLIAEYQLL